MRNIKILLLLSAVVLLAVCGCKKGSDTEPTAVKLAEGEYEVYYLTQDGFHLETEIRKTSGEQPEELARELVKIMQDPKERGHNCAFGSGVSLQNLRITEGVLNLHFSKEYNSLKSSREILARAAVVRTLNAIPGVDSILLYVEDTVFRDSNGRIPGELTAGDFELTFFENLASARLKLYFSDAEGRELCEEEREVSYGFGTTLHEMVLTQLIAGPEDDSLRAVLPQDTQILSANLNNGICYVLLSNNVIGSLEELGVKPKTMVYSIVNSLTELANVNRVVIRFEGVEGEPFGEDLPLTDALERNLDMNKEEQNGEQ